MSEGWRDRQSDNSLTPHTQRTGTRNRTLALSPELMSAYYGREPDQAATTKRAQASSRERALEKQLQEIHEEKERRRAARRGANKRAARSDRLAPLQSTRRSDSAPPEPIGSSPWHPTSASPPLTRLSHSVSAPLVASEVSGAQKLTHTHLPVCVRAHAFVHVCVHACMYICRYADAYVYVYVYVYVHSCMRVWSHMAIYLCWLPSMEERVLTFRIIEIKYPEWSGSPGWPKISSKFGHSFGQDNHF